MCILFIASQQRKDYPLIIAANRDEFHARPTQGSHIWSSHPPIFAGKDLQAGGTWMGVTRGGRISALTNIRKPGSDKQDAISRGHLVLNYLTSADSDEQFTAQMHQHRADYNGFNLLYGTWKSLQVYNNHSGRHEPVAAGVHGLSNASLNAPWPKVSRGVAALTEYCEFQPTLNEQDLFRLLQDDTQAPDEALPDTGIEKKWEKRLSPIFIRSQDYGTRASTLLLVKRDGTAIWSEQTYLPDGSVADRSRAHFQFN